MYVTNDLNSIEIHNMEKTRNIFFEMVIELFKGNLKYANSKRLEKLTVKQIRDLAAEEEVRLPSGKRKAELWSAQRLR